MMADANAKLSSYFNMKSAPVVYHKHLYTPLVYMQILSSITNTDRPNSVGRSIDVPFTAIIVYVNVFVAIS